MAIRANHVSRNGYGFVKSKASLDLLLTDDVHFRYGLFLIETLQSFFLQLNSDSSKQKIIILLPQIVGVRVFKTQRRGTAVFEPQHSILG